MSHDGTQREVELAGQRVVLDLGTTHAVRQIVDGSGARLEVRFERGDAREAGELERLATWLRDHGECIAPCGLAACGSEGVAVASAPWPAPAFESSAPPEPNKALDAARQIARTLSALHAAGLASGAVRPEHVRCDGAGTLRLWLFGATELGRVFEHDARLPFTAPELVESPGAPSEAADVFALGATLLRWLGEYPQPDPPPDDVESWATLLGNLQRAAASIGPRTGVDHDGLRRLLREMLSPRAAARPTAEAVAGGLEAVLQPPLPEAAPQPRGRPWLLVVLALAAVAGVLAFVFWPGGETPTGDRPPDTTPADTRRSGGEADVVDLIEPDDVSDSDQGDEPDVSNTPDTQVAHPVTVDEPDVTNEPDVADAPSEDEERFAGYVTRIETRLAQGNFAAARALAADLEARHGALLGDLERLDRWIVLKQRIEHGEQIVKAERVYQMGDCLDALALLEGIVGDRAGSLRAKIAQDQQRCPRQRDAAAVESELLGLLAQVENEVPHRISPERELGKLQQVEADIPLVPDDRQPALRARLDEVTRRVRGRWAHFGVAAAHELAGRIRCTEATVVELTWAAHRPPRILRARSRWTLEQDGEELVRLDADAGGTVALTCPAPGEYVIRHRLDFEYGPPGAAEAELLAVPAS